MSDDGQRWRVLLAEGGRSFRIEVDPGDGDFRLATVVEVDQALKHTTYLVKRNAAERSAERQRNTKRNVPRKTQSERGTPPKTLDFTAHRVLVSVPRNASGTPAEHPIGTRNVPPTFRGTPDRNAEIRRRRAAGESVRQVARALGVGVATVQRAMAD